ncbi:MAG: phosphate ABC transporter, permease protein PstA [Candidatus Omnitrophica bacterium CG11_big_fil_rev_8_21_14_0_20_42_13]|uniref:Phosphate transport system permease protein PstA n=1 Tax=Candidatus Ghiorseimicrobium undicola TaxID=1974746 RepID=A0A2H0M0J3_9BACT|nr:MAG: phosphate ABC transporter, permease protein PstA [Candidatus Omnitrophica bacterium CG11_big_fil_rev_8_21_14_0_20_42_13]
MNIYIKRKIINKLMCGAAFFSALLTLAPLISIFGYVISKGITSVNFDFFTHLPMPVGEHGGGMSNAIVGTLILIGLSCLWAIPLGVFGGVYLAEFGNNKFAAAVRFSADVLNGIPSIVIGIFAYTVFVLPMKSFSAISGAFALGIIMVPTIMRATEEMLRMVPFALREAALALGVSQSRMIVSIVLKTALPGILTGILLAIARIAGETAPLLFTAFGNRFWPQGLNQPIAALPLQIFNYAISPYDDWHRQAWAGALVLILMVFLISLLTRFVIKPKYRRKEMIWKQK